MQKTRLIRFLGILLIILGFLLNPLTLKFLRLNTLFYGAVLFADIVMIFSGYYFFQRPGKIIKLMPSILLSAAVTIFCLFLVAMILNMTKPDHIGVVFSEEFHHMYKPDDSGYFYPSKGNEFGKVRIRTNELGMRGESILKEKTRERILIMGDSYIQADEIPYNKTVGQVLQRKLGDNYLVMQHGYSSWSPLLELNFLEKRYEDLKPDRVFLVLMANDFYDVSKKSDSGYTEMAVFDEEGMPLRFEFESPLKIYWQNRFLDSNVMRNIAIYFFLLFGEKEQPCEDFFSQGVIDSLLSSEDYSKAESAEMLGIRSFENEIRLSREEWDEDTEDTVSLSFRYLKMMDDYLRQRNSTLTLMLTPNGWNVAEDEVYMGKVSPVYCMEEDVVFADEGLRGRIKDFALKQGIGYIELRDPLIGFREQRPEQRIYLRMDGHWNEFGHEVVAGSIYEDIDQDILSKKPWLRIEI